MICHILKRERETHTLLICHILKRERDTHICTYIIDMPYPKERQRKGLDQKRERDTHIHLKMTFF